MTLLKKLENETLALELHPSSFTTLPTGRNVFFKGTISLTIIDSDGKTLGCLIYSGHNMFILKQR